VIKVLKYGSPRTVPLNVLADYERADLRLFHVPDAFDVACRKRVERDERLWM
jgi:hypothetical protein